MSDSIGALPTARSGALRVEPPSASQAEPPAANAGLYGPDGVLARFTAAANGIADIARQCRAIMARDGNTWTLEGWLEWTGSKCGVRYAELSCMEPYPHSLFLEVYGDRGRTGDDDLNEDLSEASHIGVKQRVTFWLGQHHDATTTPSNITPAQPSAE